MLRKTVRLSGMLALVLALALAGAAPVAAQGLSGPNPDGWHAVWNWLMGLVGWGGESGSTETSGGLTGTWERTTTGYDPNGLPTTQGCESGEVTCGYDPNGAR